MPSLRQKIEDAVIEAVSSTLGRERNVAAGYLHKVAPYNGEIDQTEGPQDFLKKIRGGFPCVLVTASSATLRSESVSRTRFVRELTVELYVASDHTRDRESRLRQDEASVQDPNCDPGIYTIVEDLDFLISGNDFGLECVGYFEPSREEVLHQEDLYTLWRIQFTVKTDAHVNPRDFGTTQFTSYAIDGNLDGDAVPTPPNPFVEADGDL